MNKSNKQNGFIALITAMIISVLLLTITFSLSFAGFTSRFNILDSEYKTISAGLANACVDAAIVKLIKNQTYTGGDTVTVEAGKTCDIVSVTSNGDEKTIKTEAIFQEAYTNMEAVVELTGFPSGFNSDYALWAGADSCGNKTFEWSGTENTIQGSVHAREYKISGNKNSVTERTEYVDKIQISGSNNSFSPVQVAPSSIGFEFKIEDYRLPSGSEAIKAQAEGKYHYFPGDTTVSGPVSGLYFAEGKIDFGSNVAGEATFITPTTIQLSGSNSMVKPYSHDKTLLFFAAGEEGCGQPAAKVSGSNNHWDGIMYVLNGGIEFSGSDTSTVNGCGFGNTIKLNGNKMTFVYKAEYCKATGAGGAGGGGSGGTVTIVSWDEKNQ